MRILLCWSAEEENSWNPVLARLLRDFGDDVTEVHGLTELELLDLEEFDVCLPRFRMGSADMTCLDDTLVRSGLPMVNTRRSRRTCENKALSHLAFARHDLPQPESLVISEEGIVDRALSWDGPTMVKPLYGNRGAGIEATDSFEEAMNRALSRREDLLVQRMIWPARCWRIVTGRHTGISDAYWRRPASSADRILSISSGATIVRDPVPPALEVLAFAMLEAVEGDMLGVDVLEDEAGAPYALEINHNFDNPGGDEPAARAFRLEARMAAAARQLV